LNKKNIEIIPIGGVGEIGSNMTLFSTSTEEIIVDCGILFPNEDVFDINYLIADFSFLKERNIKRIIITHGHEDHIGAIVHLIRFIPNILIYSPPFAKRLIEDKLKEAQASANIITYSEDTIFDFGDYKIHPIRVNHSIPDTYGLMFKSNDHKISILFISDFKFDDSSPYELPAQLDKIKKLSKDSNLRLCFLDSTSILDSGKTPSEGELIRPLEEIFQQNTGQIFFTFFPSNIFRMNSILNLAQKFNKKVILFGKSMCKYYEAAKDLGMIQHRAGLIVDKENAHYSPQSNYIYLLSGSQGDMRGAFRRFATEQQNKVPIYNKDAFVYSAKIIPGNENSVYNIFNHIIEMGNILITPYEKKIHASGHPAKEDLKYYIEAFSPTHYVPIHGESLFLKRHVEFIEKNYPHVRPTLLFNFQGLQINRNLSVTVNKYELLKPILIHGKSIKIEREKISERRKLASLGSIFISIINLGKKSKINEITFQGLPESFLIEKEQLCLSIRSLIARPKNEASLKEDIRVAARRFAEKSLGYRPIVTVHLIN